MGKSAAVDIEVEEKDQGASRNYHMPSPNFDERDPMVPLKYIIVHYTGMPTRDDALRRLRNPKSKVSAHYLIDKEARLFNLVDEEKRAWHAGKGFWRGVTDVNSASIGIELVNLGHVYGYKPFPKIQIERLKDLLKEIIKRHKLSPKTALLAHSDVAPERKEDPGELFPWREFAEAGLGVWPTPTHGDYAPFQDFEEQKLLRAIGYSCPDNGMYDPATRAALLAFQRHYEPDNLTGTPERQTIARMRALARMMEKA